MSNISSTYRWEKLSEQNTGAHKLSGCIVFCVINNYI